MITRKTRDFIENFYTISLLYANKRLGLNNEKNLERIKKRNVNTVHE